MTRSIVLFNDTSTRYHHGCSRVVRLLIQGLEARGAKIIARSPARHDWVQDPTLLSAMETADIWVINGEGTLHHGAPAGETLLRLAHHPSANGKKLVLLNALYDQNPPSWRKYLDRFDLISARDSDSAQQLSNLLERPIPWAPDLSLSAPAKVVASDRQGVIFGDSVRMNKRQQLARAARKFSDVIFVPTKTLRQRLWRIPVIGKLLKCPLYWLYNGVFLPVPKFDMPLTEAAYLQMLAETELHVTGRFHAVCLSLLTRTPFLAVSSTSGKIEKLLKDLDLDIGRVIDGEALLTMSSTPATHTFSADELERIDQALKRAQDMNAALLDEVMA